MFSMFSKQSGNADGKMEKMKKDVLHLLQMRDAQLLSGSAMAEGLRPGQMFDGSFPEGVTARVFEPRRRASHTVFFRCRQSVEGNHEGTG